MAVYVVTWNLNKEVDYNAKRAAFIKHLERYQNVADAALESVRWVSANITAHQLCADLQQKLDKNDRIFVSRVPPGEYYGYISKAAGDWILKHSG
ncbi:TPA: hypothetical protein UOJ00_003257 [Stenotrophomonas maltophilia]|jgi:hypothetical protein|uniref:hypothetical protein n=1 Tax=Stenotrophomonas TaxID=40323 RepID=UPI0013101D4C|nr:MULTISPECIES: hypothetical protein [Stenotrophomonas]EKU9957753.1 hypothetical protein [Stenotrophomonas maltophilia]EKU9974384.1 hypothetical protein [Stenotrophomonas maltophilia]EKU9983857.1 hypothetical protein [Stenotrophomonas maltophilia]MBD3743211.1 hypothetical protein [Stenotrophomonas sp.]MBH1731607.1 hypothetical protein [Stenotrophomonas maltophilia]